MSRHRVAGKWGALALAAVVAAGCGGGSGATSSASAAPAPGGASAGGSGPFVILSAAVQPYAVWEDDLGSMPVTVTVRVGGDEGLTLALEYFDGLVGGSGALRRAELFDDGSHGDAVAHDGIWTRTWMPEVAPPPVLRLYEGTVDALSFVIVARDGDGRAVAPSNAIDARLELGVVSRAVAEAGAAFALAPDVQATSHVLALRTSAFDGTGFGALMKRVYAALDVDAFDFAVVFSTRTTGDAVPRSMGVRNDVQGIHRPIFDDAHAYGSAGRLQQIVYQNAHVVGLEINHEIGHRWGAFLDDPSLDLAIPTGFHWGPSTHVGEMGNGPYLLDDGADGYLVTNAHGSDTFVVNPFSTLELYLMGLADPGEVEPLRFVTDRDVRVTFGDHLPASSTRVVTIDDIETVYGRREPAVFESPNAFAAAFVVVTDRVLVASELALSSTVARYYGGVAMGGERGGGLFVAYDPPSFPAATGYRATLETALPFSGL